MEWMRLNNNRKMEIDAKYWGEVVKTQQTFISFKFSHIKFFLFPFFVGSPLSLPSRFRRELCIDMQDDCTLSLFRYNDFDFRLLFFLA